MPSDTHLTQVQALPRSLGYPDLSVFPSTEPGYFKVDLEIVWKTIRGDLPNLHAQITEVSATLSRNSDHEGIEP